MGPLDTTQVKDTEAAVEALTEMLPEQVDDIPAGPADPTRADCFLIYAEGLADLTEEELHADLLTAIGVDRQDTTVLIHAELARREAALVPC